MLAFFYLNFLYNQPMPDILNFKSPDLVNLQGWMRKAPKAFNRAAAGVMTNLAKESRLIAIKNIERGTTTRNKSFVRRSVIFDRAVTGKNLSQISAVMGSVDISKKGRSTGFEELETGIISRNKRVPLMASRNNKEGKQASRPVRMDKARSAFRVSHFRGKGGLSRKAKVVRMLMAVRGGAIGNKPFLVPRGVRTKHAKMPAGIWRKGKGGLLIFMNPIKSNVDKRTKKISWMSRAVDSVITETNLKKVWSKEIDFFLRSKR